MGINYEYDMGSEMDELRDMMERIPRKRLEIGKKYEVEIIGRTKEYVYVDHGDKKEGVIRIEEFVNEKGEVSIREHETIEAYYAGQVSGFKLFTILHEGVSTIDLKRIKNAYETKTPVDGRVVGKIKGGFEIEVGTVKCFCPHSQMGERDEDFEQLMGKTLEFKVLTFEEDGENVILSRKAFLKEKKDKLKETLKEVVKQGTSIRGKVKMVKQNGLVVDIGGIDAFIPKSEISWDQVRDTMELFSDGEYVEAIVKELDWENERIILSVKELIPDPYVEFRRKYGIGAKISGTVAKIEQSGLVLKLDDGIYGFAPVSKLSRKRRIKDPREFFKEGQSLMVQVLDIDLTKRRIFLAVDEDEDVVYPPIGQILECHVVKPVQKGLLVEAENGILGYIPENEMCFKGEKAKSKHYLPETKIKAVVINVDKDRLLLSERRVKEFEEKEAYLEYKERMGRTDQAFGCLGDLIKEKLK